MIAQKLTDVISPLCPIFGVSIGRPDDRATWRIDYRDEATAPQRAAAQTAVSAFDPSVASAAELRADADASDLAAAKIDTTIQQLVNSTPAQLMTFARNNFPTLTLPEQNRLGVILNILAVAVRPHVRG